MVTSDPTRRGVRWWDKQGLRGGFLAGIGAAVVEVAVLRVHDGGGAGERLIRRIVAL